MYELSLRASPPSLARSRSLALSLFGSLPGPYRIGGPIQARLPAGPGSERERGREIERGRSGPGALPGLQGAYGHFVRAQVRLRSGLAESLRCREILEPWLRCREALALARVVRPVRSKLTALCRGWPYHDWPCFVFRPVRSNGSFDPRVRNSESRRRNSESRRRNSESRRHNGSFRLLPSAIHPRSPPGSAPAAAG